MRCSGVSRTRFFISEVRAHTVPSAGLHMAFNGHPGQTPQCAGPKEQSLLKLLGSGEPCQLETLSQWLMTARSAQAYLVCTHLIWECCQVHLSVCVRTDISFRAKGFCCISRTSLRPWKLCVLSGRTTQGNPV